VRLKPGVDAEATARDLAGVIQEARNTELAHSLDSVPYVRWAYSVERVLEQWFVDVRLDRLFTERFWRAQGPSIVLRAEALRREVELQVAWLTEMQVTIEKMARRFSRPARSIAVLDTNILLHHRPLEDVEWDKVVGAKQVLLVVPRRVVQELDARKYVGTKLGDRARTRIAQLERDATAGEVRPGVRVEVVGPVDLDPDAARRPPIPADEEITETCEALTSYAGTNPVSLVTGDLAMQLLAENREMTVRRMPEGTMQPLGE
jgi:hypothetical protein